jgi:diphosphomevalonate decarboxylase
MTGHAVAGASLALIKYWGKRSAADNTPATGSLAVTLSALESRTTAVFADRDAVTVNGTEQSPERFAAFLDYLRSELGLRERLSIVSENTFPTAAGLASSSSGFAALTGAVAALAGRDLPPSRLSALARLGSGSATRSLFGGFTVFDAGAQAAEPEQGEEFWPEFRVVIAVVDAAEKPRSSRSAMESSRLTSPYYDRWVESSPAVLAQARAALADRDWTNLGPLIRQSYLRMFATMFTSDPPLLYWQPATVAVLHALETLRSEGLTAFETMDAGPQVKIFCPAGHADAIETELARRVPGIRLLTASPGPGLRAWTTS